MLSWKGVPPNSCQEKLTAKSLKISFSENRFNKNEVIQHATLLSQENEIFLFKYFSSFLWSFFDNNYFAEFLSEAYLEPRRLSAMGLFYENSER